jgi:proteasome lid subunit RPN8/RPN11
MDGGGRLRVPMAVRRAIIAHARRARPHECCGFIAGRPGRVLLAVPMDNVAASPVRYRIADRAHIALRRELRQARPSVALLGVYHSHPEGWAWPSPTDVDEALYPDWVYLIVGFRSGGSLLRGFRIRRGRVFNVGLD